MILAIDTGNTNIVLGCIENRKIRAVARMATDVNKTDYEYAVGMKNVLAFAGFQPESFEGAILSNVVWPLTSTLCRAVKLLTGLDTLVVGKGLKTGLDIRLDDPGQIGADLVVGAVAALQRNKVIDKVIMVITTAFVSMPSFIAGALLLTIFAVSLHLLPANGAQKNGLILPVVTLGLYPMAYITRLTRSSMLDVLGQDYIRTARAKGVPGFKVIFGHALKNSLIPVITYFGPMLAYIVTGSIVVEQIFAVPGIGRAFVNSITGRDYPLIMGTTIILACLIIIMNLVSDLLYKIVDPRIELD